MTGHRTLLALSAVLAGCAIVPASGEDEMPDVPGPSPASVATPHSPGLVVAPEPAGPTQFVFSGELTQGGWIRGQAPAGAVDATLGDVPLTLDAEGHFVAAFDRDAGPSTQLTAVFGDGRSVSAALAIAPRAWRLEHVNAPLRPGGSGAAAQARRAAELAEIAEARAAQTDAQGWRENFIRPAQGRYSGFFGAQRIYRGEPGSYHSGLDIAGGTGAPVVAPASGVVVLAADIPFSLEGNLLIIDHGQGLNSAFLHLSQISVTEGESVAQGQLIGRIGATGRASGPHLHWGLKWRDARLDPLLFLREDQ